MAGILKKIFFNDKLKNEQIMLIAELIMCLGNIWTCA